MESSSAYVRHLGTVPYETTLLEMQTFNENRATDTPDEVWLLEHPAVFTLGMNASEDHLLNPGDTPVVRVDRGGQVTWHGPGQLVVYTLLDLQRKKLGVRDLVCRLERSIIKALESFSIEATGREGAPGVYTDDAKIASIGLRVKHNRCYHGLSVNVHADLDAFSGINPCGYEGLAVTRTSDLGGPQTLIELERVLLPILLQELQLDPLSR
ncbi:MAG: lipoyl(octanoyl) transferase LipB [Gammaproteobacteria bacterium]